MTTAKLPRANVYIDGYNLYYGAVKGTKYHWLDLRALATALFPQYAIHRIKYFTARVKSRPSDPQEHVRQQMYLRALETTPRLTIFYGFYMNQPKLRPLADPNDCPGRKYVTILNSEEKGSDVNLATQLLFDTFRNDYDVAVVVSNDSDLLAPIKIARGPLKKTVGIVNPHPKTQSKVLKQNADFLMTINPVLLAQCQFPDTMTDSAGTFHKPLQWR